MMMWRNAAVVAVRSEWRGAQELEIAIEGETVRAMCYPELTGRAEVGDRVLVTTAPLARGLGTGGYAFVVAIPDRLPVDPARESGHIVKNRYTPLQFMTMGVDEQGSPAHAMLVNADSIEGMPVVVCDLHSALPAVVAVLRARCPEARIAYIMDDGGALPAWFSRNAAALAERGDIIGTITCGQAFGGDLEAVNIYSALLAARIVWRADVTIVAQGPGNLGTGTRWGFSGVHAGEYINAVNVLGGQAIAELRMSSADKRARHSALSHHSLTALTRVALTSALCPVPMLDEGRLAALVPSAVRDVLPAQLGELFAAPHLRRVDVPSAQLDDALEASRATLRSMGRGLDEDPLAFLSAGAAGYVAADSLTD